MAEQCCGGEKCNMEHEGRVHAHLGRTFQRDSQILSTRCRVFAGMAVAFVESRPPHRARLTAGCTTGVRGTFPASKLCDGAT
jgi:hypothetical protein